MISYHNFPLIKFCMIMQDPSKCEDFGVSPKEWKVIEESYIEAHPTPEMTALIESFKSAFKESVDHNRLIAVMDFIIRTGGEDWEYMFGYAGLKYTGDPVKDGEYLKSRIEKAKGQERILSARFENLQKQIAEKRKSEETEPMSVSAIYRSLASLEKAGASIPDYEKFTCGAYDAWSEIIKDIPNG